MPEIPVYQGGEAEALADRVNPQSGAASRFQQSARIAGQLGREGVDEIKTGLSRLGTGFGEGAKEYGAVIEKRQTNAELVAGSQRLADFEVSYAKDLNQAKNPAEIGAVRAGYEQQLKALGETFKTEGGQRYFAEHSGAMRVRMAHDEIIHSSTLEGVAAEESRINAEKNAAAIFALHPDEGGLIQGRAILDQNFAALEAAHKGQMRPEDWLRVEEKHNADVAKFTQGGLHQITLDNPALGRKIAPKYAQDLASVGGLASINSVATQAEREKVTLGIMLDNHAWAQKERGASDAYDEYLRGANLDKATGHLSYSPEQVEKMRNDPRLDGTRRHELLEEAAKTGAGAKPENNPEVIGDLQSMATRPDGDADKLTIDRLNQVPLVGPGSISPEVRTELGRMVRGEVFSEAEKDQIGRAQSALGGALNPQGSGDALAAARAQREQINFILSAKRNGQSVADALRDWDQRYGTKENLQKDFSKPAVDAIAPVQMPATETQRRGQAIATLAGSIGDMLARGASPTAVSDFLVRNGGKPVPAEDIKNGRWCADFVNTVLSSYGVEGAGRSAASFKSWGFPTSVAGVRPGDVAVAPPSEGATGHAMIVISPPQMHNGTLSVRVASTHRMGAPSNTGGVEWRPVSNLIFRQFRPSYQGAVEAVQSGGGAWARVKSFFARPTAPSTEGGPN